MIPADRIRTPRQRGHARWTAAEEAAWHKAAALDPTLVALARRGFDLLDTAVPAGHVDSIARKDLVASQALVQARNTLRAAWLLLCDGYEIQSLALARLVTEYVVLSWYVRAGLGNPAVWLQTERRPPSTGEQLRALEDAVRDGVDQLDDAELVATMRRFLNRLAHQDPIAFAFAYRLEEDRPSFFRGGGKLDALSLRRGGEYLLPLMGVLLASADGAASLERAAFDRAADVWWELDEASPTMEP